MIGKMDGDKKMSISVWQGKGSDVSKVQDGKKKKKRRERNEKSEQIGENSGKAGEKKNE